MNTVPVTEAEIQAYVDDALPEARRAALDAYLEQHPREAERVRQYKAQKLALQARYAPVLDEPVPQRLLRAAAQPPAATPKRGLFDGTAWRVAAGIMLLAAGTTAGWTIRGLTAAPGSRAGATSVAGSAELTALARHAAMAHRVYSPELRHPVEVGASQQDHLVQWLSRRLGARLHPPALAGLGYELLGGRLLPGTNGPVAQFMYQNAAGARLTLYVSTENAANRDTGFRYAREGQVNVFYWIDGRFGYALSGDIDRGALDQVAEQVYRQLEPGGG